MRDDGEYSLEFMECLADCGEGPVVMVDEQTYENVDAEKAGLLADLLLKGKLDVSKKFISYEQALVCESRTKASLKSKSTKK